MAIGQIKNAFEKVASFMLYGSSTVIVQLRADAYDDATHEACFRDQIKPPD